MRSDGTGVMRLVMNGNHQELMEPKPLREVAVPKVRDFTDSYLIPKTHHNRNRQEEVNDADDFVAYPPAVCPLLRADEHVGKAGEGGVEEGLDSGRDEERRREEHREDQHHQANDRHCPSRIGCPEITIILYSSWNQKDS